MVFVVALDAVQQIGKLALAFNGAVAVKVSIVGKDTPGVEPVLVLIEGQFRIHLLDGADQRMRGRNGKAECPCPGQGIFRQPGIIK